MASVRSPAETVYTEASTKTNSSLTLCTIYLMRRYKEFNQIHGEARTTMVLHSSPQLSADGR